MTHKDENLQRLLQQFVDKAQAQAMADDIRYADTAFDAHPAPSLRPQSKVKLMQNVRTRFKSLRNRRIALRWFSAAAVLLVLAGLFFYSNIKPLSQPIAGPIEHHQMRLKGFYSSELSAVDIEDDITNLSEAVENIDTGPYEPVDTIQRNLNEIENQLIAGNTEFWKG